jgi:hypothetical protein
MRLTISIILCLLIMDNTKPLLIKGRGISGYVFDREHFVLLSIEGQLDRYTPSKSDIQVAERVVNEKISAINKPMINQGGDCPIIHKRLKKYIRQYVGFVNKEGERIVWINFIWEHSDMPKRAAEDIVSVFGGCSHYWRVKVNIDRRELYDLEVNGPS